MAGRRGGRNDGGGMGRGNSGVDLGLEPDGGGRGLGRDVGREVALSEREGGQSGRGMSCWGTRPRGIGGSRRSRGVRGRKRRGVDALGKMGKQSRAGLRKGGSRCALAGRGRC